MARVVLLTTGVMEELAFHRSLSRHFPDHEFIGKPRLDGFTSAALPPDPAELAGKRGLLLNIQKFAARLIGFFAPGAREDRPRPDFVIGLEDVELVNAAAPQHITAALHDAIQRGLVAWGLDGAASGRVREALRARCSFHLMAPMTESYFFADPGALARATSPSAALRCSFDAAICDVEAFTVDDPVYLSAPVPAVPERHDWRTANRREHPKHYLAYLTDAALDGRARYQETVHGADALAHLEWSRATRGGRAPAVARFARSLFADLSDMLGAAPIGLDDADLEPHDCQQLTWPPRPGRVLRNF